MKSSPKAGPKSAPKVVTTPTVASKVQSASAKTSGGTPAPWVGRLQSAANIRFGKPGNK
ncbi:MAG: hypothetical protein V4639_06680 [Pseudomonadota bacterium]